MKPRVKMMQIRLVEGADAAPFELEAGRLFDISKVNLFVGPNNVGKSRLLRWIFARNPLTYMPSGIDVDAVNSLIAEFRREIRETIGNAHVVDFAGLVQRVRRIQDISAWTTDGDALVQFTAAIDAASGVTPTESVQHAAGFPLMTIGELAGRVKAVGRQYQGSLEKLTSRYEPASFVRVYIPALRGARLLMETCDVYADRTAVDYFSADGTVLQSGANNLFTGQNLYDTFRRMALGDEDKRDAYTAFGALLSSHFFREHVTVVPREDERTLHIRIGDRPDRPIHALGDGIQQLLIILFALFFHRDRDLLLFIEEPELFLHPSLQRSLLGVLTGTEFPRAQVFASTHSNHLLDRTIAGDEVSVFLVMREPAFAERSRIMSPSPDSRAVLDALGAVQSSLLLTNCAVWVEGITDRMYLRKWLELLAAENVTAPSVVEDVHYSFFEYAGSNLDHWQELASTDAWINVKPLCPHMIVIADADVDKKRKHQRLTRRFGMRYEVIDGIEIENLLSAAVIRKVVESYEESTSNLRRPAKRLLLSKRVGDYIDEDILIDATRSRRYRTTARARAASGVARVYAEPSGTVKHKVEFARRAIAATTSIRLMTPEAKKLAQTVYDFIATSNAHAFGRHDAHVLD